MDDGPKRHKEHLAEYFQKHRSTQKSNLGKDEKKKSEVVVRKTDKPGRQQQPIRPPPIAGRKLVITDLPDEVTQKIFAGLEAVDLLNCACVSHRWLKLASDNLLWKKLYQKHVSRITEQTLGDPDFGHWKRETLKKCITKRNARIQSLLKKVHPYSWLPLATHQILQNFGIRWQLVLLDRSGAEHWQTHTDAFLLPLAVSVRWYGLQLPQLATLRSLRVCALAPIFLDKSGKASSNSPTQRSLILEVELGSLPDPIGEDEYVRLHLLPHGIILATWKEGGELAFVSMCMHSSLIVEKCTRGSSHSLYSVPSRKAPQDDIDPQYGLHGYQATVELRSQRATLWGQQFQQLHANAASGGYVRLTPVRPDYLSDHSYTSKKLALPWKTDLFKGTVQNVCILDGAVFDEHRNPFWCFSSAVQLKQSTDHKVNYHYDGDSQTIDYSDHQGKVHLQLVWVAERERHMVTCLTLDLTAAAVNNWFGTSYSSS